MNMNKKMYIGGQLKEGRAGSFDVISPATEGVVGQIAYGDASDAQDALAAADAAFAEWSGMSIAARTGWMLKLREAVIANEEHLRECVHWEMGKTWEQTQEDYDSLVNSLSFYAEEISRMRSESLVDKEGTHEHRLEFEPVGVAVAYLAWNFPLLNLSFKIGPAMAAGCPLIIKPSNHSPLSAYAVGELCAQIGLPAGAVNIICGGNKEVGDTMSESPIPGMLTLIGSAKTACHVMSRGATSVKRYSMELGGNAPALVFDDADLSIAANIVSGVKYGNAGQICVTPNRVFVHEKVLDRYREEMVKLASAVKVGFGRDASYTMGPLIDEDAFDRVSKLVEDAIGHGAKILCGGGRPSDCPGKGHYYAPTVLDGVTPDMRIYNEEIFGPVVSLISFTCEDEVLAAANATDSGLTAYVFTKDRAKAEHFAKRLRFGEIQINGVKYGIDLPHIGIKQSGMGCDCSHLALHDYLAAKRVSHALPA